MPNNARDRRERAGARVRSVRPSCILHPLTASIADLSGFPLGSRGVRWGFGNAATASMVICAACQLAATPTFKGLIKISGRRRRGTGRPQCYAGISSYLHSAEKESVKMNRPIRSGPTIRCAVRVSPRKTAHRDSPRLRLADNYFFHSSKFFFRYVFLH